MSASPPTRAAVAVLHLGGADEVGGDVAHRAGSSRQVGHNEVRHSACQRDTPVVVTVASYFNKITICPVARIKRNS